jgi:hypothetical protein
MAVHASNSSLESRSSAGHESSGQSRSPARSRSTPPAQGRTPRCSAALKGRASSLVALDEAGGYLPESGDDGCAPATSRPCARARRRRRCGPRAGTRPSPSRRSPRSGRRESGRARRASRSGPSRGRDGTVSATSRARRTSSATRFPFQSLSANATGRSPRAAPSSPHFARVRRKLAKSPKRFWTREIRAVDLDGAARADRHRGRPPVRTGRQPRRRSTL